MDEEPSRRRNEFIPLFSSTPPPRNNRDESEVFCLYLTLSFRTENTEKMLTRVAYTVL